MMDFLKKYFSLPINWIWTLGSILFICLFISSSIKHKAPVFAVLSLVPFLMLIFNVLTEYNSYKGSGISGKKATFIFFGISFAVVLTVIAILIF